MRIDGVEVIWSSTFICRDKEMIEQELPLIESTVGIPAKLHIEITQDPHPVDPNNRIQYTLFPPAIWVLKFYGFNNPLGESLQEPVQIGQITTAQGKTNVLMLFTHHKVGGLHQVHLQLRSQIEVSNG